MATTQARATAVNTQLMTRSQSLAAVHTLLRAGLSCITFLRNLLPEDNFTESHLTTSDESFPATYSQSGGTPRTNSTRTKVNGFKIKTLTRGYTDEADRLLNYLENGIFDALEKQYLRSFIFAVYLDSEDPNNIVEAYTFNFKYHSLGDSDGAVPIMTLGEDLQNMSLNGGRSTKQVDPVEDAIRKGRAPTIGDVKKSLRTMMKTLIQAITHMDELPRHRFATFKLFYTDITPSDYEPPNFQPGDEQKDKWYFMTHNLDEVPDRFSVGNLDCGYHSVNLKVTSIATYLLPRAKDDIPFAGTVSGAMAKGMRPTPNGEILSTARQAEEQQNDANTRNLAWSTEDDVEETDEDAEGEPDTGDADYVLRADGTYEKIVEVSTSGTSHEKFAPVGIRNEDGEIKALSQAPVSVETQQEAHFAGVAERIPTRLKEVNSGNTPKVSPVEETQAIIETQPMTLESESYSAFTFNLRPPARHALPPRSVSDTTLPPSGLAMELDSPMSSVPPIPGPSLILRVGESPIDHDPIPVPHDTEMLDLETQPADADSQLVDSIKSFSLNPSQPSAKVAGKAPGLFSSPLRKDTPGKDLGMQCDCNVSIEDDGCFCEGGCGKWYHIWCNGYHSTDDPRLPAKFVCYDCRLKADTASWYMIKDSVYPQIMEKWRDLVTFRRAIKVAENTKVITAAVFAKAFDNDTSLARGLIKRLEEEDYIHALTTVTDEFGLTTETRETRAKSGKGKDKKNKSRKTAQKTRFAFNKQIKSHQKYKDHFTPDPEAESRMLGLDNLSKFKADNDTRLVSRAQGTSSAQLLMKPIQAIGILPVETQTQTQEESQLLPVKSESNQKRAAPSSHMDRAAKKMKISLALGIDLAE